MSKPDPTNIDDAIAELKATDADENTAAAALLDAYSKQSAALTKVTADLATAVAANDPAKVKTQLTALQTLNTAMAANATAMKAALAAPPTA